MLAKQYRIRASRDFSRVFSARQRLSSDDITLHFWRPSISAVAEALEIGSGQSRNATQADSQEAPKKADQRGGHSPFGVRVGFVVPNTIGNSVTRNRIRRVLRAEVSDLLGLADSQQPNQQSPFGESIWIVIRIHGNRLLAESKGKATPHRDEIADSLRRQTRSLFELLVKRVAG